MQAGLFIEELAGKAQVQGEVVLAGDRGFTKRRVAGAPDDITFCIGGELRRTEVVGEQPGDAFVVVEPAVDGGGEVFEELFDAELFGGQ